MRNPRKRRSPVGRFLRWMGGFIAIVLMGNMALAYAPFIVLPRLSEEAAAEAQRRAAEMLEDRETGDRAMILESSADALDERVRLIMQAKREIVLVTYENHDGESTRDVLAAALDRADAGVKVRFLVDGIAGRFDHMGGELFRAVASHPNVEVRFYNLVRFFTPWKHMGRMHDKYVIVDDLAFILGGRNMFDKFLGEYTAANRSLDREALVYSGGAGGSLDALREYFEGMWSGEHTSPFRAMYKISQARCRAVYDDLRARLEKLRREKPGLFAPCDYVSKTTPTRGVWILSNPTGIFGKQPTVFAQLTAMMSQARQDVTIHSPYAVLNPYMRDALAQVSRRVPVTLMINAVENGANIAASGDYLYHKNSVLATGARVLEYCGGKSYHGKAAAIDDALSVIGSFNMDLRSAYVDTELMLVIRSREINAELRCYMDALHADCRQVIDVYSADTPQGLAVPAFPLWKRAAMYIIGALLQPVRNLV